jgi:DNA-binding transcriptional ArsR family regulator
MDDLAAVGRYLERKRARWTSTDGSVSTHLRRLGRNGLIAEFRSDPDFEATSRYLHRLSDVQYVYDTGYSEFRTKVQGSIFGLPPHARGVPRQVDLIVRAALLACGVSPFGERLVRIAGNLPRA